MPPHRILLVDQNTGRRNYAADILSYSGYDVIAKPKLDIEADLAAKSTFNILILSSNLKPKDIQHLAEINPDVNFIVINNDPFEEEWSGVPEQFTPTQLLSAVKFESERMQRS